MGKDSSSFRYSRISRRSFLGSAAAGIAAPYIIPATALGRTKRGAPNDRISLACIGLGGQGKGNMRAFLAQPNVQVVALCDVDSEHLKSAKEEVDKYYAEKGGGTGDGCAEFRHFQDLLAREDIDAVTIATPDHWHALVGIAAAQAGKDLYSEKPLANSIAEGRAYVDAINRYARVFQTGSHERSRDNARYACELVRNGRIGKLHTIRVNMPVDQQQIPMQPPMEIPPQLDYDLWLGPAQWEPYTEKRCHFYFRYILDYSGGEVTDRGAHIIDLAQLGHNSDHTGPIKVEGKAVWPKDGFFNTAFQYEFQFEYADGVRMFCTTNTPRGVRFEGDQGWVFIHVHGGNLEASDPKILQEVIGPDEVNLGRSPGHHVDFINAVRTRGKTMAPAEAGHRTASMCHMANIAMRLERPLAWNPDTEKFDDDETNRLLCASMRGPWTL